MAPKCRPSIEFWTLSCLSASLHLCQGTRAGSAGAEPGGIASGGVRVLIALISAICQVAGSRQQIQRTLLIACNMAFKAPLHSHHHQEQSGDDCSYPRVQLSQ